MKFHTEFPDYPATEMLVPPDGFGFTETSWRNDMCPSFVSDEIGMTVWVDYPAAQDREYPDWKRFRVQSQDHGIETGNFLLETDDWQAVLAFVAVAGMDGPALNDWYEGVVGYRPQVDDPSMTDRDVRDLCLGYFEEHLNQTGDIPVARTRKE